MMFVRLTIILAQVLLVFGFSGCTPSAVDISGWPEPSLDSSLLVGDYLFVSKAQGSQAFDVCDPTMMVGYEMASPFARSIAENGAWDLSADTAALALLDSLFSNTAQRFYMTLVERTMERADGAYAEALGFAAKRFFEKQTCALAMCCWENGCGDEMSIRRWAHSISSEFLIDNEDSPLKAFEVWSSEIASRSKEQCDRAGIQRTGEIQFAIREDLVRTIKANAQ